MSLKQRTFPADIDSFVNDRGYIDALRGNRLQDRFLEAISYYILCNKCETKHNNIEMVIWYEMRLLHFDDQYLSITDKCNMFMVSLQFYFLPFYQT